MLTRALGPRVARRDWLQTGEPRAQLGTQHFNSAFVMTPVPGHPDRARMKSCKIVILSRFVALSVSLIPKASLLQTLCATPKGVA